MKKKSTVIVVGKGTGVIYSPELQTDSGNALATTENEDDMLDVLHAILTHADRRTIMWMEKKGSVQDLDRTKRSTPAVGFPCIQGTMMSTLFRSHTHVGYVTLGRGSYRCLQEECSIVGRGNVLPLHSSMKPPAMWNWFQVIQMMRPPNCWSSTHDSSSFKEVFSQDIYAWLWKEKFKVVRIPGGGWNWDFHYCELHSPRKWTCGANASQHLESDSNNVDIFLATCESFD